MAKATHHAAQRARERIGIPKKALDANMRNALRYGLTYKDVYGKVKQYLCTLYQKRYTACNIRIYRNMVYVFDKTILITVFPLPEKHREAVDKILKETGRVYYGKKARQTSGAEGGSDS